MGTLKEHLNDPDFIQKLLILLDDQVGFKITGYEEVEAGLVIVLCRAGIYNTYFDKNKWLYKGVKAIEVVSDKTIGMIPGYKITPIPKSFMEMRAFIKDQFIKKPES